MSKYEVQQVDTVGTPVRTPAGFDTKREAVAAFRRLARVFEVSAQMQFEVREVRLVETATGAVMMTTNE